PQHFVVLDDAVVHDCEIAAGDMRVRIRLARHAMRRPAGVGDAERRAQRLLIERVLKLLHLAETAQPLELAVAQHGEAGRVVASILEPPQTLHQNRRDVTLCNRTDDAAHGSILFVRSCFAVSSLLCVERYFFFCGRCQPGTVVCRPRSRVSSPGGASLVIVDPAPIVASAPTSTGATSMTPEPMNARSPITVRCFAAPS